MTIFLIINALMLIVALFFVVFPLWRSNIKNNAVQRDSANLEIFRDQITEMDADLRNGLLSQEMYEQGKRELQSRVLNEVGEAKNSGTLSTRNPLKTLAIVLSVLLPVTAIVVYDQVGSRHALLQQDKFSNVEFSISSLEEKARANPDDVENLLQLARSYSEMERYTEASNIFDALTKLVPNEAQLWADYADVLAMASGKTLRGKPTDLLNQALVLNPDNFKALALSGSAAMERGDHAATVKHWERLLKMIPKGDENAKIVEDGIQQARAQMAQAKGGNWSAQEKSNASPAKASAAQSGKEAISGTVALSDALKSKVNLEDTVFVLVRAAEGPKMPLAIVRKQVKDLPFKFTLDDTTSMSPQMKVSNFEQVVVIARVSKSGNAMPQPGDLQGSSSVIKPGTKGLKVNIDKMAP